MTGHKLPPEAFAYYLGLGPARSHQAVADKFGVAKRSVTKLAVRDRWKERVAEIEEKARRNTEQKAQETLEDMNERHLKSLRVIQGRALEALRNMPLESSMDAVRALDIGIRQERVIRGEPADRTAVSIEETIKREYAEWLEVERPTDEEETATDAD